MAKRVKQTDLPTMEGHSGIPELDEAGVRYAEIRDQRMMLLEQEVALKGDLLELMHKHKKQQYIREEIEIRIVHSEEKVKVKLKKEKDQQEAA